MLGLFAPQAKITEVRQPCLTRLAGCQPAKTAWQAIIQVKPAISIFARRRCVLCAEKIFHGPKRRIFSMHCLIQCATDTQIAAALIALTAKGETVDELAGMAEAMRERATPLHSRHERFIDTAGTGSSAAKRFNVSTAAAFVIAGAGLPVAKHGARAASSTSGSADVLEALGVNTAASPDVVERCLNDHGICFIFAPLFHRATARVAQVRRDLGVHTTFNLLGPLTNPAHAPFQLVGVWDHSLVERVASALALLGVKQAWVVHGADGLDEVTITGETFVAACSARTGVETFTISPEDFGLQRRSVDSTPRRPG